MKKTFLSALMLCCSFAFADDVTHSMTGQDATKLVDVLKGRTLVCQSYNGKFNAFEEKGFYPVRISAKKNGRKVDIRIRTSSDKADFGYGGDDLTDVDVAGKWVHLSVGDDGRREFMFQTYKEFADKGENDCDAKLEGNIIGINSAIWDSGHIETQGISCCFE